MSNWKNSRKLVDVVCFGCNNTFKKTESEYKRSEKNNKKHYCSINCRKISIKTISDNKFGFCKNCENKIINDNRSIFCSHSCSAIYNNKKRKGEKRNFSIEGINNILKANKNYHEDAVLIYEQAPKYCKECGNKLGYDKRNAIFCDINCKRNYEKKNLTNYQQYYNDCQFSFSLNDYPDEFDFRLIDEYGWYKPKNHGDNLNGISRDHMISIKYGYENNISSDIIKHPANCCLLKHSENTKKNTKCSIDINELVNRINKWNLKYTGVSSNG